MEAYPYRKIDAFTSGQSLGNPAACIYLESKILTDGEMLLIAKQHKGFVSEVVFCRQTAPASFHLTYYSSECEVPFCGHGTIACMYSLLQGDPELQATSEITIHTREKGTLTLYNRIPKQNAVFISAPEPLYLETPVSVEMIAKALQINMPVISNEYPIDFIDAGNRTLIVPIAEFNAEINIFPDEMQLKDFTLQNGIDVILTFCMDTRDKAHAAHTRVFAAKYGYLEDPATGSANAAFGAYMLKNDLWGGGNITLEQGGSDRVFNTVHLCLEEGGILFGGSATTRIKGVYYI
ncbi:MAG: PhzF family phenazine biosynthesis isomerase [Oscillospiraceae bacterium]|jgi:PhzF family phenazine biosynthesis protein|nr:PhzF family phenazine biosynthesis isomerase [Oscillospiraceae bacterium]